MPLKSELNTDDVFEPTKPRRSTRHKDTANRVGKAAQDAIAGTSEANKSTLANVQNYITRTAESRDRAAEEASDVIAMLHDPQLFMADVLNRAAVKIQSSGIESTLVDPYQDVDFGYSALLPNTVMGALPAC